MSSSVKGERENGRQIEENRLQQVEKGCVPGSEGLKKTRNSRAVKARPAGGRGGLSGG